MSTKRYLAFFICALLLASTASAADGGTIKVYVAASTGQSVVAIVKEFQAQTGFAVEVSPGPSSKLAKQIVEGAPADLFLSADEANADYLAEKQMIAQRRDLLGNRLVVVLPADSPIQVDKIADLARDDVKQVALAVEKVPAGEYARQALRAAGVWERVEGKVVGGEDVRATLAFVERGASAGIVYVTDPVGNSKVRVALQIDPALHRPIQYPLVLLKRAATNPGALKLYEYMTSEAAKAEFRRAGFEVLH